VRLGTRLRVGAGTLLLSIGLAGALGAGTAAATSPQRGTVSCKGVSGSIRFDPPLKNNGGSPEVSILKVVVGDCKGRGGGATPTDGKATQKFSSNTNSCGILKSGEASVNNLAVRWYGPPGTSTVSFSGLSALGGGGIGFSLGGGGTSVSGSYPGKDGGATSAATVVSGMSSQQVNGDCSSAVGLRKLTIQSGTLDLK